VAYALGADAEAINLGAHKVKPDFQLLTV
jgi:hypothetical protein